MFALFASFERNGIELCDCAAELVSFPTLVGPTTRPYRNILLTPPSNSKKRSGSKTRRQAPKRWKRNDQTDQETFNPMLLRATLKLKLIPDRTQMSMGRPRSSSLESGFYNSTHSPPKLTSINNRLPLNTTFEPPAAATVTVKHVINKYVVIVKDGKTRFNAKLFPPHTGSDTESSV